MFRENGETVNKKEEVCNILNVKFVNTRDGMGDDTLHWRAS